MRRQESSRRGQFLRTVANSCGAAEGSPRVSRGSVLTIEATKRRRKSSLPQFCRPDGALTGLSAMAHFLPRLKPRAYRLQPTVAEGLRTHCQNLTCASLSPHQNSQPSAFEAERDRYPRVWGRAQDVGDAACVSSLEFFSRGKETIKPCTCFLIATGSIGSSALPNLPIFQRALPERKVLFAAEELHAIV